MGMNVFNIHLTPEENAKQTAESELIDLLAHRFDVMDCKNPLASSGFSYLLNKGIEMLVHLKNGYITEIEFRICFSWIHTALSESYDIIKMISSELIPVNCEVMGKNICIQGKKRFAEEVTEAVSGKYAVFRKMYPYDKELRLTEAEYYSSGKLTSLFGRKRDLKKYKPVIR